MVYSTENKEVSNDSQTTKSWHGMRQSIKPLACQQTMNPAEVPREDFISKPNIKFEIFCSC